MIWYTYSLGGRFTIIVAECLHKGQVLQYRYAVATHEIPWSDLPHIIKHIHNRIEKVKQHGIA